MKWWGRREQNLFFPLYLIIIEQGLRRLNTLNTRKKFNIAGFFVSAKELEMMVLEQPRLLNQYISGSCFLNALNLVETVSKLKLAMFCCRRKKIEIIGWPFQISLDRKSNWTLHECFSEIWLLYICVYMIFIYMCTDSWVFSSH